MWVGLPPPNEGEVEMAGNSRASRVGGDRRRHDAFQLRHRPAVMPVLDTGIHALAVGAYAFRAAPGGSNAWTPRRP